MGWTGASSVALLWSLDERRDKRPRRGLGDEAHALHGQPGRTCDLV